MMSVQNNDSVKYSWSSSLGYAINVSDAGKHGTVVLHGRGKP